MNRRHARQIRAGLELARRDALTLGWSALALLHAPTLTRAAYDRASARFFPPTTTGLLPPIPANPSPRSREVR